MRHLRSAALSLALLLVLPAASPVAAATHCAELPSEEEPACWAGEAGGVAGLAVGLALSVAFLVAGTALDVASWLGGPAICMVAGEPPANWTEKCVYVPEPGPLPL